MEKDIEKGVCRICGCTWTTPCEGGCSWIDETETLCTSASCLKKEGWHRRYKQRLIDAGVDEKFAQDCLDAGMGEYDYEDHPEDCADSEMSYWDDCETQESVKMRLSPYKKAMLAAYLVFGIGASIEKADMWANENILEAEYKLIQQKKSSLSASERRYVVYRYECKR